MAWFPDADHLLEACVAKVASAGLRAVAQMAHSFEATEAGPGGVTATVLLAESHVCVHTWPEIRGVSLDVYVCNFGGDHSAKARALMEALVGIFEPELRSDHALQRGALAPLAL